MGNIPILATLYQIIIMSCLYFIQYVKDTIQGMEMNQFFKKKKWIHQNDDIDILFTVYSVL